VTSKNKLIESNEESDDDEIIFNFKPAIASSTFTSKYQDLKKENIQKLNSFVKCFLIKRKIVKTTNKLNKVII
jgi:hypothetical protein